MLFFAAKVNGLGSSGFERAIPLLWTQIWAVIQVARHMYTKKHQKKTCLNNWVILLLWNDIKKLWSWNVQITNDFFSCLSAPPTSTHLRPRLYLRASSVLPYMLWFGLPRRECTRTARLIAFQLAIAEAHRVFRQSYEFIGGNAEFCWETVCIK